MWGTSFAISRTIFTRFWPKVAFFVRAQALRLAPETESPPPLPYQKGALATLTRMRHAYDEVHILVVLLEISNALFDGRDDVPKSDSPGVQLQEGSVRGKPPQDSHLSFWRAGGARDSKTRS